MRRYCRISTLLDVRLIVAQQRSRQALTTQEMNESQAAIKLFKEQQKELENCWKQTRWAYDMISAARSRTSECGLKIGSILSCEHPRVDDNLDGDVDVGANPDDDPIYAVPYLDENSPPPPMSQFLKHQQQSAAERPSTASSERRPSSTSLSSHQRGPTKESWTPMAYAPAPPTPSGLHPRSRSSASSRAGLHPQSSYSSPSPPFLNSSLPTTPTSPYVDERDANVTSGSRLHHRSSPSSQPTTPTTPYIDDCDPIVAASPNLASSVSTAILTDSVNVELQPVTLTFPLPSTLSSQLPNGHLLEVSTQHLQLGHHHHNHPEDHLQLSPVQQQPELSPKQRRKQLQSQYQTSSHPRLPIASSPICPPRPSEDASSAAATNQRDLSSSPPHFFFPPPPSTSPTASIVSRSTKDLPDCARTFNAEDSLQVPWHGEMILGITQRIGL